MMEQPPTNTEPSQESQEKEPNINLDFYFFAHGTKEDFEKLEEKIQNCDIYIPEIYRYDEKTYTLMNQVSMGEITPNEAAEQMLFPTDEVKHQLNLIHNTKKPITFIDIPNTIYQQDPSYLNMEKASKEQQEKSLDDFLSGDFDQSIKFMKSHIANNAWCSIYRENFLIENLSKNLQPHILQLIEQNPDLDKDEINILLAYGASHTKMHHDLKKDKDSKYNSLKFSKPEGEIIFNKKVEIIRKQKFENRIYSEDELDDEFMAKIIIENIILPTLRPISENSINILTAGREIVDKLSFQDIKEISESLKNIDKNDHKEKTITIFNKIKEKIPFYKDHPTPPEKLFTSEKDLLEFIG